MLFGSVLLSMESSAGEDPVAGPPRKTMSDTAVVAPVRVFLIHEEAIVARELERIFDCAPIDPRVKEQASPLELQHLLASHYSEDVLKDAQTQKEFEKFTQKMFGYIDTWLGFAIGMNLLDDECAAQILREKKRLIVDFIIFLRKKIFEKASSS